jgi:Type ISP C-terminal specificity domain
LKIESILLRRGFANDCGVSLVVWGKNAILKEVTFGICVLVRMNYKYRTFARLQSDLTITSGRLRQRLNDLTEAELRTLLIEQEIEIYPHYINRTGAEQPVMYLLYPTSEESGQAVLVSPQEGGLKQRDVRIFKLGSGELATRLNRLKAVPIAQNILCSVPLVESVFYNPIQTAKELAQKLAESAREIERIIPESYALESKDGYLHQLLESFKRELLPDLKVKPDNDKEYSLADIYAQTVAYALFTARVFSHIKDKDKEKKTHFDRISAWRQLPETNPFLRKLFEDISNRSSEELGDKLISAIADIFVTLRAAKMETILQDFKQRTNQEDIVIRFYEDFLAAYKPKMRERRGVYYTPEPVVSYMVRSVDILLKDKFNKPLGLAYTPTPEAIFYYIYAIFHSPTYRSRYAEFLKIDFPRVPLTRNVNLFRQLGELGEQLVNLHLMKSPSLDETTSQFSNNGGGCIVDAGHPKYENGKVVINKQKDGFMDVPEAVWNFHVGGYQVCQKWLKDRKGRTLSQDDIEHYQKIVVALGQSIDADG